MKKLISVMCALAVISTAAFAQNNNRKGNGDNNWREKVRSEQVSMITSELDLTEAEAQAFWPVYNEVQQQRRTAFRAQGEAFQALKEGLDNGGADTAKLMEAYLAAKNKCNAIDAEAINRYKAVLPIEKVAKLLLTEEKFRQEQIGRLGQGGQPGAPRQGAPQQGGRRGGNRGPRGGENFPGVEQPAEI